MKKKRSVSALALWLPLLAACGAADSTALETTEVQPRVELGELSSALPGVIETFARLVPEPMRTTFAAGVDDDGQPALVVDARHGRTFFPLRQEPRSFAARPQMIEFLAQTLGQAERLLDEEGILVGVRGAVIQRGSSYFENREEGLRYRLTEPVLALLGGVGGIVEVAGEDVCIDPDGSCDVGYASYLEPVGVPTAPTHSDLCNRGICVQFHTFFNKSWFPFPWARHGSNVRFTTFSALPSTRFFVNGSITFRTGLGFPEFDSRPMPTVRNVGRDSLETAVACYGSTDCAEYQAVAACGFGSVSDPDVNGSRRTGNGPSNNTFCPG